jgi:preprotein translocase subunit SecD
MMRRVLPLLMLLAIAGSQSVQAAPPAGFAIGGEAFSQRDILDARAMPSLDGIATIMLTFAPPAAKRLKALTTTQVGKAMPVTLDGKLLAEPVVAQPIDGGVIEMNGHFALAEATALAKRISGRDPLPDSLDQ